MQTNQQTISRYIETRMNQLVLKADVKVFEQTIQNNINMKRESAKDQQDFWNRLMLNITYFVENKVAWEQIIRTTYGAGSVPRISMLENEALAQQMRIRQMIAEKTEAYCEAFHDQYKLLNVEEDAVVYDYAYASVGHSLRFDFLTFVTGQEDAHVMLSADFEETLRLINGYVEYYTDQLVNQMDLQ